VGGDYGISLYDDDKRPVGGLKPSRLTLRLPSASLSSIFTTRRMGVGGGVVGGNVSH